MVTLMNSSEPQEVLIARARAGDPEALGRLLEHYRNYLKLIARTQIGAAFKQQIDPSDVVQETFLEAFRDFQQFAGHGEPELMSWLRRILVRNLVDEIKRVRGRGQEDRRQQSLDALIEHSSASIHQALAKGISTPSSRVSRREQAVLLANALAGLPPDYNEVMVLRHLDRLSFEEIARRMDRTPGAVRMLWLRAVEKLRQILSGGDPSHP